MEATLNFSSLSAHTSDASLRQFFRSMQGLLELEQQNYPEKIIQAIDLHANLQHCKYSG